METIASFTVDHLTLEPGIYVSRVDRDPATGAAVTTFDIRLTAPNREPVMNTAEVHTIEHLGATFLRNDAAWSSRVVYFGPMGCRTWLLPLLFSARSRRAKSCRSFAIFLISSPALRERFPELRPNACGNYLDQNLPAAQWWARRFLRETLENIDDAHLAYEA